MLGSAFAFVLGFVS